MPTISFADPGDMERRIETSERESVMRAAMRNDIGSILAECGANLHLPDRQTQEFFEGRRQ